MTRGQHLAAVIQLLDELDAARLARALRMLENHEIVRLRLVLEAAADTRND